MKITIEQIDAVKFPRKWRLAGKASYENDLPMNHISAGRYDDTETGFDEALIDEASIESNLAKLSKIADKFKKKGKRSVLVKGRTYYQDDEPSWLFQEVRLETDKEWVARVQKLIDNEKLSEQYQRQQYEELKKKFEQSSKTKES